MTVPTFRKYRTAPFSCWEMRKTEHLILPEEKWNASSEEERFVTRWHARTDWIDEGLAKYEEERRKTAGFKKKLENLRRGTDQTGW